MSYGSDAVHPTNCLSIQGGNTMGYEVLDQFHQSYLTQRELIPEQSADGSMLDEATLSSPLGKGHFTSRKLRPGLRINTADWQVYNKRIERFSSQIPVVELHCCLQGTLNSLVNGDPLTVAPEQMTLSFMKSLETEALFTPDQRVRAWSITMTSAAFDHYIGVYAEGIGELGYQHFIGNECYLAYQQQMGAETKMIIQQLQQCPYRASLRSMYMEGKVLELLSIFMHRLLDSKQTSGLQKGEILKLHHAKEVLLNRIDRPPSLLELAKIVGLNDFKLKMGFKAVFGTTVFGFLRERRLERALELLQAGEMNVSQVAWTIGYSNLSHFTIKFREKFGMNPSEWIRVSGKSAKR